MFCKNCGSNIGDNEYCNNCGTRQTSLIKQAYQSPNQQIYQPQSQPIYQPPIQQTIIVEQKKMGCWRAFFITLAVLAAITFFILLLTGGIAACVAGFISAASSSGA